MMKSFLKTLKDLYDGPFQATLVISFTLVAALTIGVGTWVTSRAITGYLSEAMDERIQQDIQCAEMFFRSKQEGLARTANQLAHSNTIKDNFALAAVQNPVAFQKITEKLSTSLIDPTLNGNRAAVILDSSGRVISGLKVDKNGEEQIIYGGGNWVNFEIVQSGIKHMKPVVSVEVIPVNVLEDAGLIDQAKIDLQETPKAGPELYDFREGEAGLGVVAAAPILDQERLVGEVIVFHLFNNDFSLVDSIKESTQIDTVTIFFGDLRVSTNVMTAEGDRAVGTRVSDEVNQVVLQQGQEYVGSAFVVNEEYITRYEPLQDHLGRIVGILYVGARQKAFQDFLNTFQHRVVLVAFVTVVMTFALATPVSRVITRPLKDLQTLADVSKRVADGDQEARAPETAGGEVGLLAVSLNEMLDKLQETQKQLIQSEKLASLGQLSAGVAHELNNPLTTVLLFAEVLRKESDLSQQHQSDLDSIICETERCKTIVASLLDFARQQQVDAENLDLNHLIRRVAAIEGRQPKYLEIQFSFELDPHLPTIQADKDQIQAVLINLIDNAADAMPEGGKITLRTRNLGQGRVAFEVEDQGGGIPPETREKVFTPFFTTKPLGIGTGLGLSIVYGIIKIHRGQINLRSRVGKGSIFQVELPVRLPGNLSAEDYSSGKETDQDLIG